MYILDPIGDMIARIRNAYSRKKDSLLVPYSRMREEVLKVLIAEGYLAGYSQETSPKDTFKNIRINLKYYEGTPVIMRMKRVSKPSRRIYMSVKSLPRILNGLGISVLSTSKGIMSDNMARQNNVGGEVLFTVM